MRLIEKIITYLQLGIPNLFDVFLYRLEKKINLHKKRLPLKTLSNGCFFNGEQCQSREPNSSVGIQADKLLMGELTYFSHHTIFNSTPPRWRSTPEGVEAGKPNQHWSDIPDFHPKIGDIKNVWEPSRFDWLLVLTRAYCMFKNPQYLKAINHWLREWCRENPANGGPNWKCGQEASLRMMQTLLAAFLLDEYAKPSRTLVEFVVAHCRRIVPTLRYAVAQDNNHGTSEAAALFVAGYWLKSLDFVDIAFVSHQELTKYQTLGRKWLENRARKLIMEDGSFSQHSVNYHRVMLDTFAIVEFWRTQLNVEPLSEVFYQRARAATQWLQVLTSPITGDTPNLGANDGARLFVLTDTDYRDYRPSVQLASVLFLGKAAYGEGPWNNQVHYLNLAIPKAGNQQKALRVSQLYDKGGYCFLRDEKSDLDVFIRYPRFKFRPSHADALHLDLWWHGKNLIRDGGTYSYNPLPHTERGGNRKQWLDYFSGTESHSTVQFDARDQMPRISRFLYGNWLKPDFVAPIKCEESAQIWATQYTDSFGVTHKRAVRLESGKVVVTDTVRGFQKKAVLRWRLCPSDWVVDKYKAQFEGMVIYVFVNQKPAELRVIEGYESRYYNKMTLLPVLEVEVTEPSEFQTIFQVQQV